MSELDDYQLAFSNLEAAEVKLEKVRSLYREIDGALKNPERALIAGSAPIDARAATRYNQRVLALDDWPDGAAIKTILTEWQSARRALLAAWNGVPKEKQSSLKSPEYAPGGRSHYRYQNAY